MTSVVGSATTIDAPYMFEDSGIHKYNGKYYYSYCINFAGNHPAAYPKGEIGYMVSDSPMGPFTYQGHFLKNPGTFFGVGGNNHHAVFQFNNQWYVAYHAQTVSKAFLGDGKGYRSTHINRLTHNADGSIQEVQGNMTGVPQTANLDPYNRVEAETIAWQAGINTQPTNASGGPTANQNVTNINNGDWVAVSNVDFGSTGASKFKANVASTGNGNIELRLGSPTGTLIGTLNVTSTGGVQNWRELETNITNTTGRHHLYLVFTGSGNGNLFNLDYWQFTSGSGGNPNPNPNPNPDVTRVEAESMTLAGQYAGLISSPLTAWRSMRTMILRLIINTLLSQPISSLRGASNNNSTARVDLVIGGVTAGSFYFTGTQPTVQTLSNITHATGNQEVKLVVTTDNGTWDAYIDYLESL